MMRATQSKRGLVLWFVTVAYFQLFSCSTIAQTYSMGTGFFIAPEGYIATCYHVVGKSRDIQVRDSLGRMYKGSIALTDVANDLAVIKVDIATNAALPMRRSSDVRKGDSVFTVGYPNIDMQGTDAKVTQGIISSIAGIQGEPNSFQISVSVQPGNSGGPLLDSSGAVIGIVSAKLAQMNALKMSGALPENVNYAVKSNYLLELLATAPAFGGKVIGATQKATTEKFSSVVARVETATVLVIAMQVEQQRASPSGPPASPLPHTLGSVCSIDWDCEGTLICADLRCAIAPRGYRTK